MEQFDGSLEIRRVATKGLAQLTAIGAKTIMVSQELIKLVGQFHQPKWIEGLCIDCFGLSLLPHFIEDCCLFFNQEDAAIRKTLLILPHNFEGLWIVPCLC